ncbi:MAG: DegT/DnrJ/EryC1/StrS family aminotransferase [Victivallales bacterium]|nr:DegT/DnrJ/EryC1/StrS family aminotransferase [Victivallales bacterium]
MFHWPIVNDEMREAQAHVLESGNMSGTDISRRFEEKFAHWQGRKFALAHNNGTNALTAAMYALGVRAGDEVVCPSITYWASCLGALQLGASVVFCDIEENTLQMSPESLEKHITPRTRLIIVVHYMACPSDMDSILAIAHRHGLKVLEDVSHAQGGHYKGRMLGTFGDAAAMSLMSCKSFAIGEGGMLVTDDEEVYRRAIRWGHYDRIGAVYSPEEYRATNILPFGGLKNRMHQTSAAIGLAQLKKYDSEIAEIDRAMKYYWQGLADVKGLRMIYPSESGSDKSGWYSSRCHYNEEVFGGVSNATFAQALNAEVGHSAWSYGCNFPLHLSRLFFDTDIYGYGKPTSQFFRSADLRSPDALTGGLPVAESINQRLLGDPWFKHLDTQVIDHYIDAVHKVVAHYPELLTHNQIASREGGVALSHRKTK